MPTSFPVGQAPWETSSPNTSSFPVGQAPWETSSAPTPEDQPQQPQSLLGKVGSFLENRFQKFGEQVIGMPESDFNRMLDLGKNIRNKVATPQDLQEYNRLNDIHQRAVFNFSSGFLNPESGAVNALEPAIAKFASPIAKTVEEEASSLQQPLKNLAGPIAKSAEGNVARIFGATTKPLKALVSKITPEFIDKSPSFLSRSGLQKVAQENLQTVGEKVGQEIDKLAPGELNPTKPILKIINDAQQQFVAKAGDKTVVVDPLKWQAYEGVKDVVQQFGDQISTDSLRKVGKILDQATYGANKVFGKTIAEGSVVDAQKTTADAIRGELAKAHPDLAKVNAEYSFWKKVDQVIGATLERTKSQVGGLRAPIARVAGEVVGSGGGPITSVVAGEAANRLQKFFDSAAYNRIGLVAKTKLSNLLATGKPDEALKYVARFIPRLVAPNKN